MLMAWEDSEGWLILVFSADGRVEDEIERDERRWGKSLWETGSSDNFMCKSIYYAPYGRQDSQSGWLAHWYEVLQKQSYLLYPWFPTSSQDCSHHYPLFLFFVHKTTILAELNVKSSISTSPWHGHELTPSAAYTEYTIHWVQHPPTTAATQGWLPSLECQAYELTPECSFHFRCFSWHDQPPPASSAFERNGTVNLSHSHYCQLTIR